MKYYAVVIILITTILCTSCSREPSSIETIPSNSEQISKEDTEVRKQYGDAIVQYVSLEQIIANSQVGLIATCTSKEEYERYVEYIFEVKNQVWGSSDETIWLLVNYSYAAAYTEDGNTLQYTTGEDDFKTGEKYFIIAEKHTGLLYPHGARYLIEGDLIISLDQQTVWMYGQKQDIAKEDVTPEYFLDIYEKTPHESITEGTRPDYENSFEEMWNESEYVIRVKLTGISYDGPSTATNCYFAEVLEQYKGYPINTREDPANQIELCILKGSAEVGIEYIVGCSAADKGSRTSYIYIQETKESVYPVSDEILNKIKEKTETK